MDMIVSCLSRIRHVPLRSLINQASRHQAEPRDHFAFHCARLATTNPAALLNRRTDFSRKLFFRSQEVLAESRGLKAFTRFQIAEGRERFLWTAVRPRHDVLPEVLDFFCYRFPTEWIGLFDEPKKFLFLGHATGRWKLPTADPLKKAEEFTGPLRPIPPPDWKPYYNSQTIQRRINPGNARRLMPKKLLRAANADFEENAVYGLSSNPSLNDFI